MACQIVEALVEIWIIISLGIALEVLGFGGILDSSFLDLFYIFGVFNVNLES